MYFGKRKKLKYSKISPTSDRVVGEGVSGPVLFVSFGFYLVFIVLSLDFDIDYNFGLMNVLVYVKERLGKDAANGAALSFVASQAIAAFLSFVNEKDEAAYQALKTKKAWFYYCAFAAVFIFIGWGLMFFMFHQYPSDFIPDNRVNRFQSLVFSGKAMFGIYLVGCCWVCSTGVYMILKGVKKLSQ